MNFSVETDELLKPFLKTFGSCEKPPYTKEANRAFRPLLLSLYKDLTEAHQYLFQAGCFKSQLIAKPHLSRPVHYSESRYFPETIKTYIKENEKQQLVFTCSNVGGREIHIYFTLFAESDSAKYTNYVQKMYRWLYICGKYAKTECTNTLNIYVYPTPFAKKLPENTTTTLGPEHVNTAFTVACAPQGQIIIFREEEWFKVFIHETFHTYGLDFAQSDISALKQTLGSLFPIKSDFDVYEAYTETWARIINCALCSFQTTKKIDSATFLTHLTFCLELEKMFALYQCVKVLEYMGMDYTDLHSPRGGQNLYRENTHVFSYYVLTAIFLNDYQGFMLWCKTHNEVLLRFNSSAHNFLALAEYIKTIYNCVPFQNNVSYMNDLIGQINNKYKTKSKNLQQTLRMSIVHTTV